MLQFLQQMFNLFALLLNDPLKPATPLTNGAIDKTLQQFAPLSDDCLLQLVDCRESSTLMTISWRAPKTAQSTRFKSGLFEATCEARRTWRSHATGTSVCSGCVWRRAVLPQTSVQDASATPAGCDMQLLWTITETINTLFLVVNLLTCVMLSVIS